MTRRDFENLAEFAKYYLSDKQIVDLANYLSSIYPRFNYKRFLAACKAEGNAS